MLHSGCIRIPWEGVGVDSGTLCGGYLTPTQTQCKVVSQRKLYKLPQCNCAMTSFVGSGFTLTPIDSTCSM